MEIGYNQGLATLKKLNDLGFKNILLKKDISKNDRFLFFNV